MRCCKCEEEKPEENFPWRNKEKGVRSKDCKTCRSEYHRSWYAKNAENRKSQVSTWNKANHRTKKDKVLAYLMDHPCVDCGETDPVVLEFDHVDPSTKTGTVSNLIRQHQPWSRVEAEILKCDVRCANCHRRRTSIQFGWLKGGGANDTDQGLD